MTANGLNFVWRCILSATSAPSGGVKSKSNRNQHNVWENKQVTIGIPGWVKYTWVPNETETKAAWQLYVELATRIASQPFDPKRGSLRAAFDSLMHGPAFPASPLNPAMIDPNRIRDFDPAKHAIIGYCGGCGHSAAVDLDRVEPDLTVPELRRRLRCAECGSREVEIRIAYIAAGGYRHS